jgi:hypothetical protein
MKAVAILGLRRKIGRFITGSLSNAEGGSLGGGEWDATGAIVF